MNDFNPVTQHLQARYVAHNPQPGSQVPLPHAQATNTAYDQAHNTFHPQFHNLLDQLGYYDVFLIDAASGRVVYSASKEADFATSLLTGPYRDTGLAKAFAAAQHSVRADDAYLQDVEPYLPSYNGFAAFVASPILDGQHVVGVLAFQVAIDRIHAVMTSDKQW